MNAFGCDCEPDPRIMDRLTWMVRRQARPRAFATAGAAVAQIVMVTRAERPLPEWAHHMADAMVGALVVTQARSRGEEDPERLVQLATAAAVLSLVRPRFARACDSAIASWMGAGLGEPDDMCDSNLLVARTLLALFLDDLEQAADCIDLLMHQEPGGPGWALHDWLVARRADLGPARETECWHNLRVSLADACPECRPPVVLLATLTLWARLGVPRSRAMLWLDEVAAQGEDEALRAAG